MPTDQQLNNRLTPTPATYAVAGSGLFRTQDTSSVFYRDPATGTVQSINLGNAPDALSKYGIDYNSLASVNGADSQNVAQSAYKGDLNQLFGSAAKATTTPTTVNGPEVTADIAAHPPIPNQPGQTTQPTNTSSQPQVPAQTVNQDATQPSTPSGYMGPSIVDYLASVGQASDFASRAKLAQANGIQNYAGTAAQNTQLLNTLRTANPGTATNASGLTTGGSAAQSGAAGGTATTNGTTATADPYAGLDPIQKQVKMYTDAATALGLPTIKQQMQTVIDQQTKLTDEMNDKISDANNNPWFSEGVRVNTIKKITDSYQTKLDTLSNLETVYDSLYKQGQAQVENVVSGAQADVKAANDLAQKQLDAASALAKDNTIAIVNGRQVLVNKETGKTVADLGPDPSPPKAATPVGTASERAASELQQYSKAFVPGAKTADGTPVIDNNGFITPTAWKQAIADYTGTRAAFIKEFGYLLYSDPKSGIASSYGLTPTELKLVTGAL